MKKLLFTFLLASILLLCGCQPETAETMRLRVVDGAESGNLILAGERQSDVYTLFADGVSVYLDGEKADASALQDGMMIEIDYAGGIDETWPAQIDDVKKIRAYSLGTQQNPGGTLYDLSGLYLQVLDDLWAADDGLNGGIQYVSVDLSQAPGSLTEGEKAAITYAFGQKYGVSALTLSSQELAEQGYLTESRLDGSGKGGESDTNKLYQWEDGILFTITDNMENSAENYSLPVIKFNASKWRTPLGAYFFSNCTVVWPEMGSWSGYNVESEAIS